MIRSLRPYQHRLLLAIALSLLAHALLLWLPKIDLPRLEKSLPPLQAHFEPQPRFSSPRPAKPQLARKATPPLGKSVLSGVSAVTDAPPMSASAVTTTEISAANTPELTPPISTSAQLHSQLSGEKKPPPKHAELSFSVRSGENGFEVGEIQHRLSVKDGRYTLNASTHTTGLASLFKSFSLIQSSTGLVNELGFHPETFTEEKDNSGRIDAVISEFDWNSHLVHLSNGENMSFGDDVQDSLSILYQLSRLPLGEATLPVTICNGRKVENYDLAVSVDVRIPTAIGELRTVHLRKIKQPGEPGLEIWLSMEHRLLPVKVQYIEPDGTVSATISITDIRVSDE